MQGPDAWIDPALCNGCGECVPHCPFGAIYKVWWEAVEAPPELQDVTLSPSPTPGTVTVSGLPEGLRISAVDLSGREVGSAEASGGTVVMDLSGSCSGLVLISSDLGPVGAVVLLRP
jgi:ferredoxin